MGAAADSKSVAKGLRARLRSPVFQFTLAAITAVALVGAPCPRTCSTRPARTRRSATPSAVTELAGRGNRRAGAEPRPARRRPRGGRRLDAIVGERILSHDGVVRVKIWKRDGKIIYSDEPRLIGDTYTLGADDLASSLERQHRGRDDRPVAAGEPLRARRRASCSRSTCRSMRPGGEPLLFETYIRSGFVASASDRGVVDAGAGADRRAARARGSCSCRWPRRSPGACAAARRSASGCCGGRSTPPRWSAGGSPRTSMTASSRTWPASPTRSRRRGRATATTRAPTASSCAARRRACARASATCAGCWSRSTRPTCTGPGSARRSRTWSPASTRAASARSSRSSRPRPAGGARDAVLPRRPGVDPQRRRASGREQGPDLRRARQRRRHPGGRGRRQGLRPGRRRRRERALRAAHARRPRPRRRRPTADRFRARARDAVELEVPRA